MTQRLVLEAISGSLQGRVFAVAPHSSTLVGRLPECGVSIPEDLTVSRQHCRIDFHPPECRLTHLSQTGETTVNGSPVHRADLRRGDEIGLGMGNVLRVRFDEIPAGVEATAAISPGPPPAAAAAVPAAAKSLERQPRPVESSLLFTSAPTSSGLTVYGTADDDLGFDSVLGILLGTQDLYAIMDFRRLEQPAPAELTDPHYLFGWIPAESQPQLSPVLVSPKTCPAALAAIHAGWGKDGLVCFGSTLRGEALVDHWRKAIGVTEDQPGKAMTAYHWPSLVSMMLACQSPKQLEPLLSGVSWLFVEAPGEPGAWKLFADEKFASVLTSAGLTAASAGAKTEV